MKSEMQEVRSCRICRCTQDDCSDCIRRTGELCYWVDEDLCSACKEVREKPILFSTELVQAILDGRKTQTRRVVKKPEWIHEADQFTHFENPNDEGISEIWWDVVKGTTFVDQEYEHVKCPYFADELWVRETCLLWRDLDGDKRMPDEGVVYKTDDEYEHCNTDRILLDRKNSNWAVTPSIHMPRWASRIQLLVKDVGVERVQEISYEDILAEGLHTEGFTANTYNDTENLEAGMRERFKNLWNSINAKPKPVKRDVEIHHYVSYPWEDIQEVRKHRGKKWYVRGNPFVWVVDFEIKNVKGV